MKIVSTTLTNSRADVIERAISAIAPEVDECLVIDTGATDNTLELAKRAAGDKFACARHDWQDFSTARNTARLLARGQGADWTVQADTDDTMHVPGLRAFLETVPEHVDVIMVPHQSRSYEQTRIVRARCPGQYRMPVHEYFWPCTSAPGRSDWHFACIPRPAEDLTEKYTRYAAILEAHAQTTTAPGEKARSLYYLGDCHAILKNYGKAIAAFEGCLAEPGWDAQASWAGFRAGALQHEMGLLPAARGTVVRALARSPSMPELHWLGGFLAYHAGEYRAAKEGALRALEIGPQKRAGFCWPPAQDTLPRELLHWADYQLSGGLAGSATPASPI